MKTEQLEKLKKIFEESKGSKIKAKEIANIFNISDDPTYRGTRTFIKMCIEKYNLPIVADGSGYYLIQCKEDFDKYMQNLNSRIVEIDKRKNMIKRNLTLYVAKGE